MSKEHWKQAIIEKILKLEELKKANEINTLTKYNRMSYDYQP